MKHTIQTLKKNLTLAEVEALEKELREHPENNHLCEDCHAPTSANRLIKELLRE